MRTETKRGPIPFRTLPNARAGPYTVPQADGGHGPAIDQPELLVPEHPPEHPGSPSTSDVVPRVLVEGVIRQAEYYAAQAVASAAWLDRAAAQASSMPNVEAVVHLDVEAGVEEPMF